MAFVSAGMAIPKAFPPRRSQTSEAAPSSVVPFIKWSNLRIVRATTTTGNEGDMIKIKYEGTRRREKELTEMIQKKIREAEEVCGQDKSSDGCKVAWDEVEEISAAKSHLRLQLMHSGDPLENFCQQNPETDECRIYDD